MKNAIKIGLMVFFILVVVRSSNAQYSVSGKAKYSDNGDLITTGNVRALDANNNIITTTAIQSDGTYILTGLPGIQLDIIIIRNSETEDHFVATYYPNKIDPSTATVITPSSNMTNIDIYAQRLSSGGHSAFSTTIAGNVTLENKPAANAIVYLKKGNSFTGYAITDSKGDYSINNAPSGDYILVVYRLGSTSDQQKVTISNKEITNADFSLAVLAPKVTAPKKESVSNTTPNNFSLSQNYPNPFNPSTVISFNIPVSGTVSLVVLDPQGKEVKTLVNGFRNSGNYSVNFNASDMASGVYFYKLTVNDAVNSGQFTETKRMILIK